MIGEQGVYFVVLHHLLERFVGGFRRHADKHGSFVGIGFAVAPAAVLFVGWQFAERNKHLLV